MPLYKDFDLTLASDRIRITPLLPADTEPYTRLMFGEIYDLYVAATGKTPSSGLEKEHSDELHALRLPDDDSFIGWVTLQRDEEGRPDIGVHLVPEQQNKGLGPEAVRLFVNHLHRIYGLKTVYLRIHESNLQSQKAMGKLGVVKDGEAPDPVMTTLRIQLSDYDWKKPGLVYCYHLDLPVEILTAQKG